MEVDLLGHHRGHHRLGNELTVGSPLAGQRARIRLDGQLMHVITQDGVLWRTLPCPHPAGASGTGCRACAWPGPARCRKQATAPVQRRVSSRGGIQVAPRASRSA